MVIGTTQRLVIRSFTIEDLDDLQAILGDDETMKFCEPAYDRESTARFLRTFCIGQRGALAAAFKDSGKVIGYILFKRIEEGVCEIGWIFYRSCWGQGLAYEACSCVLNWAFSEQNIHKVFAETIDPVKSVALMEKLGMRREGIQRAQTRDTCNRWADVYLYGLLREEWLDQKNDTILR